MDKVAIIAEIASYSRAMAEQEIPEGCITYQEIEEQNGWCHDTARKVMLRLVAAGKFERVNVTGRVKCVFRKIG